MGNVCIVIYDNITWNKDEHVSPGESFPRNEYPEKREAKLCASTISWSLKLAWQVERLPAHETQTNLLYWVFPFLTEDEALSAVC